jgi:hypothetical protein
MARPILTVKNIDTASKRYSKVAKKGRKDVRAEFGIPFALQDIIAAKPRAKSAILGTLNDGDRLNGQKLVRLLAKTPKLTVPEVVSRVEGARF